MMSIEVGENDMSGDRRVNENVVNAPLRLIRYPKNYREAPVGSMKQRRKKQHVVTKMKYFGTVRYPVKNSSTNTNRPILRKRNNTTEGRIEYGSGSFTFQKVLTKEPTIKTEIENSNGEYVSEKEQPKRGKMRRTASDGNISFGDLKSKHFQTQKKNSELNVQNLREVSDEIKGNKKPSGRTKRTTSFSSNRGDKQKIKSFTKEMQDFRTFKEAEEFAKKSLKDRNFSYYSTWKLYTVVAETARRHNMFDKARLYYEEAVKASPSEPQIWMEYSKLEEECGRLDKCEQILKNGLSKCYLKDAIVIKLVKFYEQMNKVEDSRRVLAYCESQANKNPKKVWKIILEGAILEAKGGNIQIARNFFTWLMKMSPHQGRIYMEAYKMEEKIGSLDVALKVLNRGIEMVPKHAPLWYCVFHLHEKRGEIELFREKVERALEQVTKEIRWKIYCEAATIEERMGNLSKSRQLYVKAVNCGPPNVRWKIWIAGARTELNSGNSSIARMLLGRALQSTVPKNRFLVYLELAKLEEWVGNVSSARAYVKSAQSQKKHEWKVYLESILLELRANNNTEAMSLAEEALKIHPATGRLWAIYIRLNAFRGEKEQYRLFRKALQIVPKSGEVWCEGARLRMNPFSPKFNVRKAKEYLNFAIKFTPQYGDSFIEFIRAENLLKGQQLHDEEDTQHMQMLCVNADPNYGQLWFFCKKKKRQPIIYTLRRARTLILAELYKERYLYQKAISYQNLPYSKKKEKLLKLREKFPKKNFETALFSFFTFENNPEAQKEFIYQSIFADSLKKWI